MRYFILLLLTINLIAATAAQQYVTFRKTVSKLEKPPRVDNNQQHLSREMITFLDRNQKTTDQMITFLSKLPEDNSKVPITGDEALIPGVYKAGMLLLNNGCFLCEKKVVDHCIAHYKLLYR